MPILDIEPVLDARLAVDPTLAQRQAFGGRLIS
jgi:hypothetical protein